MECRYRECDNQSRITLQCDTVLQPIKTQEPGLVINAKKTLINLVYFDIFFLLEICAKI